MRQPLPPLFGANVDPSTTDPQEPFNRALIADVNGLDLITVQDHPYINTHFDTWTLLTALAMATERVHIGTNVLNTPLRPPPVVIAKMVATLDILSEGRVELGLGAGANPDGAVALGAARRTRGEAFNAFEDLFRIVRGVWDTSQPRFSYEGSIHHVHNIRTGPAPAHPIRIWVGASGPRMQRLTGRLADGIFISSNYKPLDQLAAINQRIDEGAQQAGRVPSDIRRGYNLMGVLDLDRDDTKLESPKPGYIYGNRHYWIDEIVRYYHDYGQDTFIFWPVAGNELLQLEVFAKDIVPAAREKLAKK